ncbi:hypothetical protein OPV22_025005 [Ensete ventricosum]|uniref:Uncharacterized protein n=1 Tax=Ensete ventricosum TaxID=4639 RepID=A0A445MDK7_ENSVE|nr:hypothetical protein OPV22_025005 [Ensete ventricosum]RWW84096.1 hypothetical protein BHE74_00007301 [Ensete ventricosum]RZR72345.1 hypothetical protein BHM03_00012842 [Ensete ventricosum]
MGNAASLFACFCSKRKRRGGHEAYQRSSAPPSQHVEMETETKPGEENGNDINEMASKFIKEKRMKMNQDQQTLLPMETE